MSCSNCGGGVPPILPYGIVNGIVPFLNFTNYSPVIPKFYYDVYSLEEREKHICKSIAKLEAYSNYLAGAIGDLSDEIGEIDLHNPHRLIMVEDYGAKGDGKTDCTQAIQTAIRKNPNCKICFKGGVYLISKEIATYGVYGGQNIDLGGATLKWAGCPGGTMFHSYRTELIAEGNPLYGSHLSTLKGGHFVIENGNFDGSNTANVALEIDDYHSMGSNIKIWDVKKYGLQLSSKNNPSISQQCYFNNFHIFKSNSAPEWSEAITSNGLTLNTVNSEFFNAGFAMFSNDNMFVNIHCHRYTAGAYLYRYGGQFANCHFTANAKNPNAFDGLAETAGVLIDPADPLATNVQSFVNIYFDNVKYCVWCTKGNREVIDLTNSYYFDSRSQLPEGQLGYKAYLTGGASAYMQVENFTVRNSSDMQFYGYGYANSVSYQRVSVSKEIYNRSIHSLKAGLREPWLAQYKVEPDEKVEVIRDNTMPVSAGDIVTIGGIMNFGTSNKTSIEAFKIAVGDRSYGYLEVLVNPGRENDYALQVLDCIPYNNVSLVIGKPVEKTLDSGQTAFWVPLGLQFNVNANTSYFTASLDPGGHQAGYLLADVVGDYVINPDDIKWIVPFNKDVVDPRPTTLLVGDSYLYGSKAKPTGSGKSWGDTYADMYSDKTQIFAKGGAGFWQNSPENSNARGEGVAGHPYDLSGVANCSIPVIGTNKNNVRKVIAAAGYNDGYTEAPDTNKLKTFITKMQTAYPNAEIYIAYLYAGDSEHYTERRRGVENLYKNVCNEMNVNFTSWVQVQTLGIGTYDGIHPSEEVGAEIGEHLYDWSNN